MGFDNVNEDVGLGEVADEGSSSESDLLLVNEKKAVPTQRCALPKSIREKAQVTIDRWWFNMIIPILAVTELISQSMYAINDGHDWVIYTVLVVDLCVGVCVTVECAFRFCANVVPGRTVNCRNEAVTPFFLDWQSYFRILAGPVGLIVDIVTLILYSGIMFGPLLRILMVMCLPAVERLFIKIWALRPQLGVTILALVVLMYLFAFIGHLSFGDEYHEWFGNMFRSMFTIFQIMTLEDWYEIARPICSKYPWAWVYFVSIILFFAFVMMNVLTGIIIDGLQGFSLAQEKSSDDSYRKVTLLQQQLQQTRKLYVSSMTTMEGLLQQLAFFEAQHNEKIAYGRSLPYQRVRASLLPEDSPDNSGADA